MYEALADPIASLMPAAEQFALDNDRATFRPFFECLEEFMISENLWIGGKIAIDLLCDVPLHKDSWFWDVYCFGDGFKTCNNLVQKLSEVRSLFIPADTASLRTILKNHEFILSVNARQIACVHILSDRQFPAKPSQVRGYFTQQLLKCMPARALLATIYRTLYDPLQVSAWDDAIRHEKILGARVPPGDASTTSGQMPQTSNLMREIRRNLQKMHILCGKAALIAYGVDLPASAKDLPLEIMCDSCDVVARQIESTIAIAGADSPRVAQRHIVKTILRHGTFDDFRALSACIFLCAGETRELICVVYHDPSYTLVPVVRRKNYTLAQKWVCARILALRGIYDHENYYYLTQLRRHFALLTSGEITTAPQSNAQQLEWAGIWIPERITKKKLIEAAQLANPKNRFQEFYPAIQAKITANINAANNS